MTPTFEQQQNARTVLDHIEMFPERHDQGSWASPGSNICGTTACVAGWTAILCLGWDEKAVSMNMGNEDIVTAASRALGLNSTTQWTENNVGHLFFLSSEETAKEALRYIANGKEIDWETIKKSYDVSGIV